MTYLYHEKQDAALCGLHTLNNLLQGHFISEVDLMQIALQLDERERQVMMELGTGTLDFIKFAAEDSGNVALDGNFSIQVLSQALATFDISCESILHESMADSRLHPENEEAFICNLQSHWFPIRKIDGTFWNLNSLENKPTKLSELYLSAFIAQLQQEGYNIFVIRGKFPNPIYDPQDPAWIYVSDPSQHMQSADDELERAIQESLRDAGMNVSDFSEQDEIELAIKLSMETESAVPEGDVPEEPSPNDPETTLISIKTLGGFSIKRKFYWRNTIGEVYAWVFRETNTNLKSEKYSLISNHPRTNYSNPEKTLEEYGLTTNTLLIIAPN
eukprot:TRINITY_DN11137_c0_g1_i1.p1 TRINITY_DN11137_c0_g1~~TRINITY_DN11137_c0_g1_i1.p1  ORF type:complete len:330 (-),score=61.39 TRINITY_DN11137_c0_g1_i1:71-1060(-)